MTLFYERVRLNRIESFTRLLTLNPKGPSPCYEQQPHLPPPTTTNIANSRPAYYAPQQRQGVDLSGVKGTIRSHFEKALHLIPQVEAKQPLTKAFDGYIKRLEEFGDPFKAVLDPKDDRRLFIIKENPASSTEQKPLSTRYFHNNALLILERLQEIHNETLPRLVLFQD